jgi:hypothetical protein
MRISHLAHTDFGVHCSLCHEAFRVPGKVLSDPLRLIEAKEFIAARHSCGGVRAVRATHNRDNVRLIRPVCSESKVTPIDQHWSREIERLFPAVGAAQ